MLRINELQELVQEIGEKIEQLIPDDLDYRPVSEFPQTSYLPAIEISLAKGVTIKPVNNEIFFDKPLKEYKGQLDILELFEDAISDLRIQQARNTLYVLAAPPFNELPVGSFEIVNCLRSKPELGPVRQYLQRVYVNGRNAGQITHLLVIWQEITELGTICKSKIEMFGRHKKLFSQRLKNLNEKNPDFISLTKREYEVLELVRKGKSTAEIAQILYRSKLTISTNRKRICMKLGVSDLRDFLL